MAAATAVAVGVAVFGRAGARLAAPDLEHRKRQRGGSRARAMNCRRCASEKRDEATLRHFGGQKGPEADEEALVLAHSRTTTLVLVLGLPRASSMGMAKGVGCVSRGGPAVSSLLGRRASGGIKPGPLPVSRRSLLDAHNARQSRPQRREAPGSNSTAQVVTQQMERSTSGLSCVRSTE